MVSLTSTGSRFLPTSLPALRKASPREPAAMAWRSVASNHADLVRQMTDNGVLRSRFVQDAFRAVDRGLFVYPDMRDAVYVDAPIKQNHLHQSAPHMYAAALEALDLRPNVTFLNVGSGTGWFNTMVAVVAGRDCINHGVEIFEDLVQHARTCYEAFCEHWRNTHDPEDPPFPKIEYFHGNGLLIDPTLAPRYDRIYVGAACPPSHKDLFCQLLAVDGILVLPVDDEFLRIHKLAEGHYSTSLVASVRFAPLLEHINVVPQLPAHVWSPAEHRKFPKQFRDCVLAILLMLKSSSNARAVDLGKSLWLEILTYCSREWFTPELTELEALRRQLQIERSARLAAEEALRDAKRARQEAIMERDYYRFLVNRLVGRLRQRREGQDNEEGDEDGGLPGPDLFTLLTLGGLLGPDIRHEPARQGGRGRGEPGNDDDDGDDEENEEGHENA